MFIIAQVCIKGKAILNSDWANAFGILQLLFYKSREIRRKKGTESLCWYDWSTSSQQCSEKYIKFCNKQYKQLKSEIGMYFKKPNQLVHSIKTELMTLMKDNKKQWLILEKGFKFYTYKVKKKIILSL